MSLPPYTCLVKIALQLPSPDDLSFSAELELANLQSFVTANRILLDDARDHLDAACAVPLEYDADYFRRHCPEIQVLRNLADAFYIEGILALQTQQYDHVITAGLTLIDLGNATARGGLQVDYLASVRSIALGSSLLSTVREQLDSEQRSRLLRELARVESEHEPVEVAMERDELWTELVDYPDEEINSDAMALPAEMTDDLSPEQLAEFQQIIQEGMSNLPEDNQAMYTCFEQRTIAAFRLLALDLALQQFEALTGTYPAELEHLRPGVLSDIPRDPFTGQAFLYQPKSANEPKSFLLYSPGPLQIDHGGQPGSWPEVLQGNADFSLQTFTLEDQ
ncbi:hypothetical protein AB1L30_17420 [Bremerella sp. JC817]|uniref:hypothetical protein n=1 Tax=Bremerella sp. JC817 TaxID=3231756 RepID=UPI003457D53D